MSGENFPPGALALAASYACWYLFLFLALSMFAGRRLYSSVGFTPGLKLVDWMEANHGASLAALLVLNQISTRLIATGAFEVALDGRTIHSKLETGFMPDTRDIMAAVSKAYRAE